MDVRDSIDSIPGFRASGIDGGIHTAFGKPSVPDLALIAADVPCTAAGLFTTNLVKAAPVQLDMARLKADPNNIQAVLINTASANACTGEQGLQNAEQTAAWTAHVFGCQPEQVLVMSTGVIGIQLPMEAFQTGIPAAVAALQPTCWPEAARAIMTTDTKPKLASVAGSGFTIAGIAKGAGMIAPNLATMLSVLATDVKISADLLSAALHHAAEQSFNRIVVDGDMSTNDSLVVLASGQSDFVVTEGATFNQFADALTQVCIKLAQKLVKDAEGGTKFIELAITGTRSVQEAKQIGNTIATSPLVKTAFYGGDANWGRILAAAGRAGVTIDPNKASLWYGDLQLMANGMPLGYDDAQANALAAQPEVHVRLDLGLGDQQATIWTCDLSHEYVNINGHYRT